MSPDCLRQSSNIDTGIEWGQRVWTLREFGPLVFPSKFTWSVTLNPSLVAHATTDRKLRQQAR